MNLTLYLFLIPIFAFSGLSILYSHEGKLWIALGSLSICCLSAWAWFDIAGFIK